MRLAWVLMTCLVLVPLRSISAQTLEEKKIARLVEQLANDSFQARDGLAKSTS